MLYHLLSVWNSWLQIFIFLVLINFVSRSVNLAVFAFHSLDSGVRYVKRTVYRCDCVNRKDTLGKWNFPDISRQIILNDPLCNYLFIISLLQLFLCAISDAGSAPDRWFDRLVLIMPHAWITKLPTYISSSLTRLGCGNRRHFPCKICKLQYKWNFVRTLSVLRWANLAQKYFPFHYALVLK